DLRLSPAPARLRTMNFASAYDHGFVRIAAATIPVTIADPAANARAAAAEARACPEDGVGVVVFPALCRSGSSIDDLFLQDVVLDAGEDGLAEVVAASTDLLPVLVVGAPLRMRNRLFNCAVVVHRGQILGVAPKSLIPTYREFYERRHFAAG